MKKRNTYPLLLMTIIFIIFTATFVIGQPPLPGGHGYNGNQGTGGTAPVDGGGLLLLAWGLGYGVVKYIRNRMKENGKFNN